MPIVPSRVPEPSRRRIVDGRLVDAEPQRATAVVEHLVAELSLAAERSGVRASLAVLNARTRFRFTGLYRVESPLLRNLHVYDRENPSLRPGGDIDLREERCCASFVARGALPGTPAAAARADARSRTRATSETIRSFFGVSIRGADGCVHGLLCHFDWRARLIADGEARLLAQVAAIFAEDWLKGRA